MGTKRRPMEESAVPRVSKRRLTRRTDLPDEATPAPVDSAIERALFAPVWRMLREAGWTSKPPHRGSLSDLYRYIPPGGDPNGVDGTDFFSGENALLENYRKRFGDGRSSMSTGARESVHNSTNITEHSGAGEVGFISSIDIRDTEARVSHNMIESGGCGQSNFSIGVDCDDRGKDGMVSASDASGYNRDKRRQDECNPVALTNRSVGDGINEISASKVESRAKKHPSSCVPSERLEDSELLGSGSDKVIVGCNFDGFTINSQAQSANTASIRAIPDVFGLATTRQCTEIDQTTCAVCKTECSTDRSCTWCKKFLHHFCSHDVCLSLKLTDGNGGFLEDFGNSSYCSRLCYTNATELNMVISGKTKEIGSSSGNGPLRSSATTIRPSAANAGTTTTTTQAETSNRKTKSTSRQNRTALNSTSRKKQQNPLTSLQKAPRKKSKAEINALAMKEELFRRAKAAAEKFVGARVAFAPADENWMPLSLYREVGSSYLTGVVTRYTINIEKNSSDVGVPLAKFQIQWTCTAFQKKSHVHDVGEEVITRGVCQFARTHKDELHFGESWTSLCSMVPKFSNIPVITDEFEEIDDDGYREWSAFRGRKELQLALCPSEVEQIESMTFSPTASLGQPPGLFTHPDGSSTTQLRQESRNLFGHSATSAFFAFIPLSFWSQVVAFTNAYADATGNPSTDPVTLDEIMVFLGILWYMTLYDKGEMRNYWVDDEEETIFSDTHGTSLERVMTWRRFIYIRKNLSFRSAVTTSDIQRDPAARIRPLISILKSRSLRHVDVGRNVAVDEASIACRSRYARHIIVFNSHKPTGKYHFKLYVCCCSTSWYVVSFKLHCSSTLRDRMDGVVSHSEVQQLTDLLDDSTDVRTHVMEVTASLRGSNRIVNTDNFYTSCLLLESLRSIGLYGRGTVRAGSMHFPRFAMIKEGDDKPRGYMKQAVCLDKHIVAASWVDGSIVNIVSNADASSTSTVYRRVKDQRTAFTAPTCIGEYNSAMQGVDRHDQLRGRFSLADGHSFQKWHKKLAMAMIDIARCNAFICDGLARGTQSADTSSDPNGQSKMKNRDRHRSFVVSLVRELFNGDWKKCIASDVGMVYTTSTNTETSPAQLSNPIVPETPNELPHACVAKESWVVLRGRSRAKRKCTVCKFECRKATQKTDYCETHQVALCKRSYPVDATKPHLCQYETWTCWQKYHQFYLPKLVYTVDGNLRRTSPIYKAQQPFLKEQRAQKTGHADATT